MTAPASRRQAPQFSAAAIAAGMAAAASPDAELIRLCDRLTALDAGERLLFSGPGSPTDPDGDPSPVRS